MDIIYNGNSVDALFAVYQLIKAETVYKLEDITLYPVSSNISTWPSVAKGSMHENIVWIIGTGASADILSFWAKHCPKTMIIENHPNAKKYFDCAPDKFIKYDTEVSVSYLMHCHLTDGLTGGDDIPPYIAFLNRISMWCGEITMEDRILREAFYNHEIMCRSLTNKSEIMALLDKFVIAFTCYRGEVISTYYPVIVNRDLAMNKMIETVGKIMTITDENATKWKLPRSWIGEKVFTMDTTDRIIDSTDTSWLVFQKYPDVNIYTNYRLKGFNAFQYSVRVRDGDGSGTDHIDLTEDNLFYGRKHSAGLYRKMADTAKLGPMPFI